MSIEAVAAAAVSKEVANSSAAEAVSRLANQMEVTPANDISHLQPEQMYMHDDFKAGELNAPECEDADVYEAREKNAAEDLKNKLEDYHHSDDFRNDVYAENHHPENMPENIIPAEQTETVSEPTEKHHMENSGKNDDSSEKNAEKLGGSYDDVKKTANSEKEQVHHQVQENCKNR